MDTAQQANLKELQENLPEFLDVDISEEYVDFPYELEGKEEDHFANLATYLDQELLEFIGSEVIESYESDETSRSEWCETIVEGVENLGIAYNDEAEATIEGGCSVEHPIILENAVKYQAKASGELLPATGPARTQVLGALTEQKETQAHRVRDHLNYQATKQIVEFYPESEKMYICKALMGSAFKKKSFDPGLQRPVDEFVSADKLVVNNGASDLRTADRISHLQYYTPRQMLQAFNSGVFLEPEEYPGPQAPEFTSVETAVNELMGLAGVTSEYSDVYSLVEQHVYMSLPEPYGEGDDLPLPYVVTVDRHSQQVLAIRRNWRPGDETRKRFDWFTHYIFVPSYGFYGLGYIHLLGNFQKSLTSIMRMLVDAGQFATLPAGFKSKNAKFVNDEPLRFGEFRDVEHSTLERLQDMFIPLAFKEPSPTLLNMYDNLGMSAQKFADSTDQVVADSTNYGPVGTTMALLEASTKFFSAIHKRAYYAQEQELKILAEINYYFMDDEYPFDVPGASRSVFRVDYDPTIVDIVPVANPNISSRAERIALARTQLEFALQSPQLHNLREAYKRLYRSIGVEDPEKVLVEEDQAEPLDPLGDLQAIMQGKPIRAFPGQEHQAHIQVKTSFLQAPSYGGNDILDGIIKQKLQANIQEHMVLDFAEKMGATNIQAASPAAAQALQAQRIAELDQIAKEVGELGSPASILADAERMQAETGRLAEERRAQEAQFKLGLDAVEKGIKLEELRLKAEQGDQKAAQEIMKLGADLMKEGHSEAMEDFRKDSDEKRTQK